MGNPAIDNWDHATKGKPDLRKRNVALAMIHEEIGRSYSLHGCPRWGRHEAYAIIKEELDEVWEAIRADAPFEEVMKELIQTAAMCVRYIETEPKFLKETEE